jgi:hypothetical protein
MKIRPVGAELFHADGRTDMMQLIVAFRNFVNTPKKAASVSQQTCSVLTGTSLKSRHMTQRIILLLLLLLLLL